MGNVGVGWSHKGFVYGFLQGLQGGPIGWIRASYDQGSGLIAFGVLHLVGVQPDVGEAFLHA